MRKYIILLLLIHSTVFATTVRFETTLGNIDIELYEDEAPSHSANFLNYVNDGDYNETVIHRSEQNFVLQGGGYRYNNGSLVSIPLDPELNAEVGISNTRGTVALAKVGSRPSGDSQWFINLKNNAFLDTSSGGYTVFGRVVEGMDVVDLISSLRVASNSMPLLGYGTGQITAEHLIFVTKAYVLDDLPFKVNAGISGAWYNPSTTGQGFYFEMLPDSNFLLAAWFTFDLFPAEDGVASTIGHPGHRWFTAQGIFDGNTFSAPIALTRNGLFDSTETVDTFATGTLSITFSSCFEAVVTYEFDADNVAGTFPITRLSGDNVAMCEALSEGMQ